MVGLDLGACLHLLAAFLLNVCDGYVFGHRLKVVLVWIDSVATGMVGKFDVAEEKNLGATALGYLEIFAAAVGKEKCSAHEDGCKSNAAVWFLGRRRLVHVNEMLGRDCFLAFWWGVGELPRRDEQIYFRSKLPVGADLDVAGAFPAVCPEARHQLAKGFPNSVAS